MMRPFYVKYLVWNGIANVHGVHNLYGSRMYICLMRGGLRPARCYLVTVMGRVPITTPSCPRKYRNS